MQTKLPYSANEDSHSSPFDPSKVDQNERKKTFTTAKYDATRHSDTLDRRKVEKALVPAQSTSDAWISPSKALSTLKRLDPSSPEPAGHKVLEERAWGRLRTRSPWSCSVFTLTATLSALLFLVFIFHSFVTRQSDSKGCDMYYTRSMFFNFADFDTEHTRFASKYSLHLYREVGFDEDPKVAPPLPGTIEMRR